MQLSRHVKTSDHFGRYYTDPAIAKLLIESMALRSPKVTIDLGAGSGSLVGAAGQHWKETEFITVDIDVAAASSKLRALYGPSFTHHAADALDNSLAKKIGVNYGDVDAGLCNPPYIRPKWQKHFGEILEDAGLSHIIPKIGTIQADVLFIGQNLRFLSSGGKLGLILPDGIIAGEKYARLRKTLATEHKIERVIELPRRVFRNTDAKAHIVVLSKGLADDDEIQIQRLNDNGFLSQVIRLSPDQATRRLDYSYLASVSNTGKKPHGRTLRDVTHLITRGSHSSSQRRSTTFPIFHTTDFVNNSTEIPLQFCLDSRTRSVASGILAKAGDIVIARVGRNLENKVCCLTQGEVAVSDCVFVLRVKSEFRENVLDYLTSTNGRKALHAASHGVGAAFITVEALLALEF
ncbi:MAG: N-6 DNA methylase [Rhodocyclaceae bacterium]